MWDGLVIEIRLYYGTISSIDGWKEPMGIINKVRENASRRKAKRLGLELYKSRARKIHLEDRGLYRLVNETTGHVVAGDRFDLDLQAIESFLDQYEETLKGSGMK